jgi:spore maturation protein A
MILSIPFSGLFTDWQQFSEWRCILMMNGIWGGMIVLALLFGAFTGMVEQLNDSMIQGALEAVSLMLKMAGGFAVWCGLMEILKRMGAVEGLTKRMKRGLCFLFPGVKENETLRFITMNLSANMLGLGNAATPMGLKAMEHLSKENGGSETASRAMCMFLVLNASSVQLFPGTVMTLRMVMGSQNPGAVILPTLGATAVSAVTGVLMCLLLQNKTRENLHG